MTVQYDSRINGWGERIRKEKRERTHVQFNSSTRRRIPHIPIRHVLPEPKHALHYVVEHLFVLACIGVVYEVCEFT